MPNATLTVSLQVAGLSISKSISRTGDNPGAHEVTLPVAQAGSLTTRTSDTQGTITAGDAGHGISSSDVVDVYWDGGVRYGMTVGTVSGTSIPLTSSGAGDVLPAASTAVTITTRTQINTNVDGDNLEILGILAEYIGTPSTISNGHVDMQDSGSATIEEIDLVANVPRTFDITGGDTNVFTGNVIETIYASNGDATNAATLKLGYLQDSTP